MRLVDADTLKEHKYHSNEDGTPVEKISAWKQGWNDAIDAIANYASTVDAVEVVRCRDCVYCKRFNDVWYLPKKDELLCTLHVETYHTTENDFCSCGKRRKDETG